MCVWYVRLIVFKWDKEEIVGDIWKTKIQFIFNLQNATVIPVHRYLLTPTAQVRVPATEQPVHR